MSTEAIPTPDVFEKFGGEANAWIEKMDKGQGMYGWGAWDGSDAVTRDWPTGFQEVVKAMFRGFDSFKPLSERLKTTYDAAAPKHIENTLDGYAHLAMLSYQKYRRDNPVNRQ